MRRSVTIAGIVAAALLVATATANAATPVAGPPPAPYAGSPTSAAVLHNWGTPSRVDDFNDKSLPGWGLYNGPGHAGNGKRSPSAASVANGILTINGSSNGTTEGMAWNPGQRYGRWEGRVRAPQSDESYNALLLLWPDAENFPVGGEIDFMEMTDHLRQETNLFLHHGAGNNQVAGKVKIDATQWHNWAVEWTPRGVTAYVDGKEWWKTTTVSILPPGPMHLCIQLDWFPGNGKGAVTPSKMEVDWVRQYTVPESVEGTGDPGAGLIPGLGDVIGGTPPQAGPAPAPWKPTRPAPPTWPAPPTRPAPPTPTGDPEPTPPPASSTAPPPTSTTSVSPGQTEGSPDPAPGT